MSAVTFLNKIDSIIVTLMAGPCSFYSHLCLSIVGASLDWLGFLFFYWYMETLAWSVWVFILAFLKTWFTVIPGLYRQQILHQDIPSASTTLMVLSSLWPIPGVASTVTYIYWTFVFPTHWQELAVLAVGTAITWAIPCSYFSWRYCQVASRFPNYPV